MTATPATQPTALTPVRKRLIRQAYARYGTQDGRAHLRRMPSFAGISDAKIIAWASFCVPLPPPSEWKRPAESRPPRRQPASPAVTQAITAPADPDPSDPGTTGEWYTALAIAKGLGIGVERVYGWRQFGWLCGGPLYTAADIRAFVRGHPLEIKHRALSETSWLWLVSVLAGSREQGAA